jgi:hypothetical protein
MTSTWVLDLERQWNSLRTFLSVQESYLTGVTGSDREGFRFHYKSSYTEYKSDNVYPTHDAAMRGLGFALLRSFVYNSFLSTFVVSNDKVILQSEKNISEFGLKIGLSKTEITDKKATWILQGANGFLIFRER